MESRGASGQHALFDHCHIFWCSQMVDLCWLAGFVLVLLPLCPQGSYQALHGGSTLYALEALTGDYVFKFLLESDGVRAWHCITWGWRVTPLDSIACSAICIISHSGCPALPALQWRRYELVHGGGPKADTMITKTTDLLGGDEMFDTMLFYSKQ